MRGTGTRAAAALAILWNVAPIGAMRCKNAILEAAVPCPAAWHLALLRLCPGWRAGDEDEQNRKKADSVSKLSKVKAA
jgi:hypothetical protein